MTEPVDDATLQLAARLGARAENCTVVSTERLSTSLYEVVLAGDAAALAGVAGNDVMLRVTDEGGRLVRRRYSVRDLDAAREHLVLWIGVDHEGPGVTWVTGARPGDTVEVVGPRGKIVLDPVADWHLFVGDVSGLGAFYRMAQSIEVPGRAVFIVEIDAPDDALPARFDEGLGVTGIFVDRDGRAPDDPAGLLGGLAAFALPPDDGHAYLFGEFHALRAVQAALLDRGLTPEQISHKAYWRRGRANADHGEPDKADA
jgi:NADPH-dependent ferric siderophore reductase